LAEEFEYGLIQLDMLVPDDPGSSGLVFIDGVSLNPAEYIALEKARKYRVDAVYFRRFESGRASIPQIYIYDFTSREENKDEIGEMHRKLWNSGQVPLFFIFTKTEVKIFNCLKSPDLEPDTDKLITSPLETIHLAAEVESELEERKLKEFSARKFNKYPRIVRVLRIYDKNVIYLVKPKQLRYWLRSVAIRDADETFEDLVKQGY
jgi:hypothetical protein